MSASPYLSSCFTLATILTVKPTQRPQRPQGVPSAPLSSYHFSVHPFHHYGGVNAFMQTPHPHLVTQFTEDARATEDRLCDRRDCPRQGRKIQKGEKIHYIASYKAGHPGKLVCDDCLAHYQGKLATSVRRPIPRNEAQQLAIVQDIRKSVSAAQSRLSINPPLVMPMTQQSISDAATMPPPPVPRSHLIRSYGPDVHVPIAWPNSSNPSGYSPSASKSVSVVPFGGGYGPQHAQYPAQRQHWASVAHKPTPPSQTYSLDLVAVYESSRAGKRSPRLNTFGSIREGLREIDAHSTAQDLMSIALDTLTPLIRDYCMGFSWREAEFVVRDKAWVNLRTHANTKPYFYDECLRDVTRKNAKVNTKVFKTGKQFTLYVVVPEKQWEELEEFRESVAVTKPRTSVAIRKSSRVHQSLPSLQSTTPSVDTLPSTSGGFSTSQDPAPVPSQSGSLFSASASSGRFFASQDPAPHLSSTSTSISRDLETTDAVSVGPAFTHNPMTPSASKRQHHRDSSTSTSGSSVCSPPPKKVAIESAIPFFNSPDRDQLKRALQSGGKTDLNTKILQPRLDPAVFYPIPIRKLDEIIDQLGQTLDATETGLSAAAFDIKAVPCFSGHIRAKQASSALLGVGAFKTTQALELTLYPLRPAGLGSVANQLIAAKRPFTHSVVGGGPRPPRAPFDRPHNSVASRLLYREANVLYWANALLNFVYDYITQCIADATSPPPFNIPQLRFVEAGLLFTYPTTEPDGMTYLVEEVIQGEFVKYIHNSNAVPCQLANDEANEIAKFLSFTQHVQYTKTGGQVYISDYQGSLTVLTDPQVLTHPDVGAGKELFADGNVESSVQLFEAQHRCSMNKFCTWPGFKMKPFKGLSSGETSAST